MKKHEAESRDVRRSTAIILLAVAAFIILSNTGFLDLIGISGLISWAFRTMFSLIPAGIFALGVLWIIKSREGQRPVTGGIVALFGLVLLISQQGWFGLDFGNMFVPMWLVIVAFILMNPRDILPRRFNMNTDEVNENDTDGAIQLVAFMGGGELDYTVQNLRGGEVYSVWGGYQLNFSEADMEGDSMELNVFCIMGGCEVVVPSNWEVEKRGAVCIMGGFSNKTRCMAEELELPRKTLIIKGFALMGGGEIRN